MAALGDNVETHAPGDTPDGACVRILLFDADGDDCALREDEIDPDALTERQLLWVDVEDDDAEVAEDVLRRLSRRLGLGADALRLLRELDSRPRLHNVGDWFLVHVATVEHEGKLRFTGRGLSIVCGRGFVVTLHHGKVEFLDQLRSREHAETQLGTLSAESFTASLLDWQVDAYLHAVTDFETAVDRLEVAILTSRIQRESLPDLARLRRGASRLRRLLAPHRHVFGALARPDFRPGDDSAAHHQFRALEQHFERAMDAVENARELVVGSFELFATRTAQRTNDTMRVLTFVTVLLGTLAVVAGALGMNFKAPFFDTGAEGFWAAIGVMGAIAVLSTLFARWRRWF
ncbi:MAG TPA: CorA family divalent cation transporter [Xanthomonadaceae bacterium]|nr:CorA family divalent cation transporter [Xanthomonadaceae bacterium]